MARTGRFDIPCLLPPPGLLKRNGTDQYILIIAVQPMNPAHATTIDLTTVEGAPRRG
ncbi:MAG: hypothetical protein ACQETD_00110 [Pseudomonadota bacterium]